MRVNVYNVLIASVRNHAHRTSLGRVLESLGDAVSESARVIARAKASGDGEYFTVVEDDESEVVERLIGAAFVVAQVHVTGVTSSIKRLSTRATKAECVLISGNRTKREIMRLRSATVGSSAFSRIEVINAMANYFKHQDEWPTPWAKLDKQQKLTADIIVAIGGNEGNSGNLRTGLEALGIGFDRLEELHREIATWAGAVIEAYDSELRGQGVL